MVMSSFLLNSSPYVEPKFPPSEEYSQNNYIPSQHGEDYYSHTQRHTQNYHYMQESRQRYGQENYSPGNLAGYGHSGHAGHASGHPAGHGGSGGGGGCGPVSVSANQGVTPVDSLGVSASGGQPYPSPGHPHSDSPSSVPSPSPAAPNTPHTPVNGMTQCGAPNNNNPVIYPWMKRVHVNQGGSNSLDFSLLTL